MQGRLSKPRNGKIQTFPADNWQREFELAAIIGYSSIEWVIDSDGIEKNPLFSNNKRNHYYRFSFVIFTKVFFIF